MNTEPKNWNPGDGVTICRDTDRITATIVRVSSSGRTIWTQDDCASLDPPDWKPIFVPDGSGSICINQHEQRYHYHRDLFGRLRRVIFQKDGRWCTTAGEQIVPGRSKFHDYNF